MPGCLSDVHAKLRRARAHLLDLAPYADAINKACVDALSYDYDKETREHVTRISAVPEVPDEFTLILGDAIHNTRSSLDHLAWQIIYALKKKPVEGKGGTAFPIKQRIPRPDKSGRALPQLNPQVPVKVRRLLDDVQPYKRTHPRNHQLAILANLDNADKHHGLLTSVVGLTGAGWFGEWDLTEFNGGPYQPGDEVCRFVLPEGEPEADFKPSLQFKVRIAEECVRALSVSFGAGELIEDYSLRYIEKEVLPRFAYLFA